MITQETFIRKDNRERPRHDPIPGGRHDQSNPWTRHGLAMETKPVSDWPRDDHPLRAAGGKVVRILIVDDNAMSRDRIARHLMDRGVDVVAVASSRQDMAQLYHDHMPDLVILDLDLSQNNGFDLLRDIRSSDNPPAVIGIGNSRREADRATSLELGADDFLTKPFGLRELHARIRAVLRRLRTAPQASSSKPRQRGYEFGGWRLELRTRSLTDPFGTTVDLSKTEYALLVAFLETPQQPLSREQLLQATRVHEDLFDRTIDVRVLRLRRKLEIDPDAPRIIRTERGFGYVFSVPVISV